jgi:hypothetical protein
MASMASREAKPICKAGEAGGEAVSQQAGEQVEQVRVWRTTPRMNGTWGAHS